MIRLSKVLLLVTSSLAMTGIALAQDAPPDGQAKPEAKPETTPEAKPAEGAAMAGPPPLVLGKGKIAIAGSTVNINLSADAVGKPFSLAPSVFYGVNEKLTVGLVHDGGSTPWTP